MKQMMKTYNQQILDNVTSEKLWLKVFCLFFSSTYVSVSFGKHFKSHLII